MICPRCESSIPDDSVICPACRVNLALMQADPEATGSYCASCGSFIAPGETLCPSCGMPIASKQKASPKRSLVDPPELDDIDEPEDVESSAEQTRSMARIKSAIPTEHDEESPTRDRMPAARTTLVAALAALALIGGLALVIVHPWDPSWGRSQARPGVDTSQAGYPGLLSSLAGQDTDPDAAAEIVSGDDATFEDLEAAFSTLGDFATRLDESAALFSTGATTLSAEERIAAYGDASQLGIDLSNFIDSLDDVDVTSGTYADDLDNAVTLANWLRNRSDALTEGWRRSAESEDPEADTAYITGPVKGSEDGTGVDAYKSLFDRNFESWRPVKR